MLLPGKEQRMWRNRGGKGQVASFSLGEKGRGADRREKGRLILLDGGRMDGPKRRASDLLEKTSRLSSRHNVYRKKRVNIAGDCSSKDR